MSIDFRIAGISFVLMVSATAQGRSIDPFSLPEMNPATELDVFSTADYSDAVFVIETFQLRCSYCNTNAPNMRALAGFYSYDERIKFIDLGIDSSDRDYGQWIDRHQVNHYVIKDNARSVFSDLGAQGTPTTYILDRNLNIAWEHSGVWGEDDFAEMKTAIDNLTVEHWDVKGLQQTSLKDHHTFTVADNWVTEYLKSGGNMQTITGLERPDDWEKTARFESLADKNVRIPNDFDWRRMIGNGLMEVRSQQNCGSCWAFAVTSVLESLQMIDQGHSDIDLAEQTLVSSCSSSGSCFGGYFNAFDYLQANGLPQEADDPYRARNTRCKQGLQAVAKISDWAYIGERGRSPTTEEIKKAIYTYGPVAVDVNASFGAYADGVYNRCNNAGTDHMVTLVGWNDDEQYWIMRNSWGASWGEGGYMRIKYTDARGRKCNGIGGVAAYAVLAR